MSIFYKFRAWKEAQTIPVEGTGISVFDLKKEIIQLNNLASSAKDFDLVLLNSANQEEYRFDNVFVPRATSILVQRLPAKKPGKGNAQYYVLDSAANSKQAALTPNEHYKQNVLKRGNMSKRFDQREEVKKPSIADSTNVALTDVDGDEAARIDAMFAASGQQWEETQNQMAQQRFISFRGRGGHQTSGPSHASTSGSGAGPSSRPLGSFKPPPSGYVCYRCGQSGHWIQECPSGDDASLDGKPRVKRTTGIPKSFLQSVETPSENQSGLMMGTDGKYVIARPDSASWAQHRSAAPKNLSAEDVQGLQPEDPDLTCSIDSRLLKEAVKTPCCSTSFCQACIDQYLTTHDFVCPECESKIKSLDQLKPDQDRRKRVADYVEEMVRASKEETPPPEKKEEEPSEGLQSTSQTDDNESKEEQDNNASVDASATNQDLERQDSEGTAQMKEADNVSEGKASLAVDEIRAERSVSPLPQAGQFQFQQQQAMNPMMNPMMMNPMMMNPMFMQQQLAQFTMMLSNPNLPPPMRTNLQQQYNMLSMMLMQAQSGGLNSMNMPYQQPSQGYFQNQGNGGMNGQFSSNAPAYRGRGKIGPSHGSRLNPFGVDLHNLPKGAIKTHLKRGRSEDIESAATSEQSGDEKRQKV